MTRLLSLSSLAGISMILGGLLPLRRERWSQQALLRFMAFGSGVLLGAAFLFIIPEAVALGGSQAGLGLVGAFVAIFATEQLGLAHACPECVAEPPCRFHPMGWVAFSALGLHSLIDGLSITAGFAASEPLGLVAASAVLAHKVPTGISLAAILTGSRSGRDLGRPGSRRFDFPVTANPSTFSPVNRAGSSPDPAARRLLGGIQLLARRFAIVKRADVQCCGLTVAQSATLQVLRAEGPLRLSALGRRLWITPSTLTRNLARLEDAGLVAHETDRADARAARVRLTPAGCQAAVEVDRRAEEFARGVLARLPAERRRAALDGLHDLLLAVREATEDCCSGAFEHLMTDSPRCCPRTPPSRLDGG